MPQNAGIHVKKYIKALKARKGVLLEKLNVQLAEAGQKPVVEKDRNKTPPEEEEKEQPSWATPELDKLGTTAAEKLEKANEARSNLDVALGLSSEVESGPDGESGPAETGAPSGASGPAEVEKNVTEATNSTELSPFAVLTKRMAGIAKMAREMLGGPKKNASAASSGASGSAEDAEEETDASGSSGASGPEMKSLTRTFVSDGATSTVTTVFHKKGEADADGKVWGAVKKLEKEHGKMKAEIDAVNLQSKVRTNQNNRIHLPILAVLLAPSTKN